MTNRQRAHDLFVDRQHVGPRLDPGAQQAQDAAHNHADNRHNRRHECDDNANRPRNAGGRGLWVIDRVGFGQDLGKDQNQSGHDQRRHRNPAFAKQCREQRRRQGCGKDVHQVVAQKDAADQAFTICFQIQRDLRAVGPALLFVSKRAQLAT